MAENLIQIVLVCKQEPEQNSASGFETFRAAESTTKKAKGSSSNTAKEYIFSRGLTKPAANHNTANHYSLAHSGGKEKASIYLKKII